MNIQVNQEDPRLLHWQEGEVTHLDVRPFLEEGDDPYALIMHCVNQVAPGNRLVIHALFEPKPMKMQVTRMGLASVTNREGEDHWTLSIWQEEKAG